MLRQEGLTRAPSLTFQVYVLSSACHAGPATNKKRTHIYAASKKISRNISFSIRPQSVSCIDISPRHYYSSEVPHLPHGPAVPHTPTRIAGLQKLHTGGPKYTPTLPHCPTPDYVLFIKRPFPYLCFSSSPSSRPRYYSHHQYFGLSVPPCLSLWSLHSIDQTQSCLFGESALSRRLSRPLRLRRAMPSFLFSLRGRHHSLPGSSVLSLLLVDSCLVMHLVKSLVTSR